MALIGAQIISPTEFDVQLSKHIVGKRPPAIDFATKLIKEAVLGPAPVALRTDFSACLTALECSSRNHDDEGESVDLFQQLATYEAESRMISETADSDELVVKEQLIIIMNEWIHLMKHPSTSEKLQLAFVLQLQRLGITTDDQLSCMFFRKIIETSVEQALRTTSQTAHSSVAHYISIDAVARILVLLVKYQHDQNDSKISRAANFSRMLSILMLVFANRHNCAKELFNQKPFFRLYSSILSELHAIEGSVAEDYADLMLILSESFMTMQPLHFPGFTFAWMTLISHRLYMPKILSLPNQQGWLIFSEILLRYYAS